MSTSLDCFNDFRDKDRVAQIAWSIENLMLQLTQKKSIEKIRIMEVCGGHTMAILKNGLRSFLPKQLELLSGPGCPVCVTPLEVLDSVIALAQQRDIVLTVFGDLIRVPGSYSSLQQVRAQGALVRPVYSPLDALQIAREHPQKNIVMPAIGFETTIPTLAAAVLIAEKEGIDNFFVYSAGKTMPAAMRLLADDSEMQVDAFLCPGHVAVITGSHIFDFLAQDYGKPCVVAGFEPFDILMSIEMILRQVYTEQAQVEIQYTRAVTSNGNRKAQEILNTVFEPCASVWRGMGEIAESGLCLRSGYRAFDAAYRFPLSVPKAKENPACICGDIMRAKKIPTDCRLFRKQCHPQAPQGSCMVSDEGTCAAYFKYASAV